MNSFEFFVAGLPKGQPRPKAYNRGKHAGVYDPGTADGWKDYVRSAARRVAPKQPMQGPVALRMIVNFPRPKAHLRKDGRLRPGAPIFHTSKPDSDNVAKAVMDAITNLGTYWRDDAQVARLDIQKRYTVGAPGALIVITEMEEF